MRDPKGYDIKGPPSLLAEICALAQTIAAAKAEIAALRVDDINGCHIPSATDELDAIVTQTATATDEILEVCEALDNLSQTQSGAAAAVLQDSTRRIYEACSFQDITGQRITKVVATLKTIEAKVASMIEAFGGPTDPSSLPAVWDGDAVELLNGPQLPACAMAQTEIDRLMADF